MTTARERVIETVAKGSDMVAAANAARVDLQKAKQAEDAVRLSDPTRRITEEANRLCSSHHQGAEAQYQAKVAEAQKPLAAAQAVFDAAKAVFDAAQAEARQGRDRVQADASQEATRAIREATKEQETKQVVARAGVHTAQEKVAALEAGIDRYARQVEQQLGINLKQLLALMREE